MKCYVEYHCAVRYCIQTSWKHFLKWMTVHNFTNAITSVLRQKPSKMFNV